MSVTVIGSPLVTAPPTLVRRNLVLVTRRAFASRRLVVSFDENAVGFATDSIRQAGAGGSGRRRRGAANNTRTPTTATNVKTLTFHYLTLRSLLALFACFAVPNCLWACFSHFVRLVFFLSFLQAFSALASFSALICAAVFGLGGTVAGWWSRGCPPRRTLCSMVRRTTARHPAYPDRLLPDRVWTQAAAESHRRCGRRRCPAGYRCPEARADRPS